MCCEEVAGDEVGEDFLAVWGGCWVCGTESEGVGEVGFCLVGVLVSGCGGD